MRADSLPDQGRVTQPGRPFLVVNCVLTLLRIITTPCGSSVMRNRTTMASSIRVVRLVARWRFTRWTVDPLSNDLLSPRPACDHSPNPALQWLQSGVGQSHGSDKQRAERSKHEARSQSRRRLDPEIKAVDETIDCEYNTWRRTSTNCLVNDCLRAALNVRLLSVSGCP